MKKALIPAIIIIALIAIYFVSTQSTEVDDRPAVEIVYVEWASEVASTNVVKAVFEEVMDYKCTITPVSAAAMWQAVASGDRDGFVAAWLPTTHGHYLEAHNENVLDLGANLVGTKIGLVVPEYVKAASIDDLKVYEEEFDKKIIGIDPGAGIMSTTQKAMKEYGLENYSLVEGSDATMIAVLKDAIANEEAVVITGWTPHWMFTRWDLRYLEDPKQVYGGAEEIHTIVRKGFPQDMPKAHTFLDQFKWAPEDMQEVMNWNQDNPDPYANAVRWIKENPEIVKEWLQGTPFADELDAKLQKAEVSDANAAM